MCILPPERNTCFILETSYLDFPFFRMSCIFFLKSSESDFASAKEVEGGKKIFGGDIGNLAPELKACVKISTVKFL